MRGDLGPARAELPGVVDRLRVLRVVAEAGSHAAPECHQPAARPVVDGDGAGAGRRVGWAAVLHGAPRIERHVVDPGAVVEGVADGAVGACGLRAVAPAMNEQLALPRVHGERGPADGARPPHGLRAAPCVLPHVVEPGVVVIAGDVRPAHFAAVVAPEEHDPVGDGVVAEGGFCARRRAVVDRWQQVRVVGREIGRCDQVGDGGDEIGGVHRQVRSIRLLRVVAAAGRGDAQQCQERRQSRAHQGTLARGRGGHS